jgi:hypothetical protein
MLANGGLLLLDSAALRQAFPKESPVEIAEADGGSARAVSASEVITCAPKLRNCSIRGNGALVSVDRINSTEDAATANLLLRWIVHSTRRGNTVSWASFRVQLARGAQGWVVVSTKGIGES